MDIGAANVDLLATVCLLAGNAGLRDASGGARKTALFLIEQLCNSIKDHSAANLLVILSHPSAYSFQRRELAFRSSEERLARATNCTQPLEDQLLAAISVASGFDLFGAYASKNDNWNEVIDRLSGAGVRQNVIGISKQALQQTGVIAGAFVPFVCARLGSNRFVAATDNFLPERNLEGLPTWVLNGNTRTGLQAMRTYLSRSPRMSRFISEQESGGLGPVRIIAELVCRLESENLSKRLQWQEGLRLTRDVAALGIGITTEAVPEARRILLSEFELLNDCRKHAFENYI